MTQQEKERSDRVKNSTLRLLERVCAVSAMEYRRAVRDLEMVEQMMAREDVPIPVAPAKVSPVPAASSSDSLAAQVETLQRKLTAANAELLRYETRLFAYERTIVALRRENAELEALYRSALSGVSVPKPCLSAEREQPFLRVAPPLVASAFEDELPSPAQSADIWKPKTALDHLSLELIAQFDRMMAN